MEKDQDIFSTKDHWIQEFIKRIFNSGLFWAVGLRRKNDPNCLEHARSFWGQFFMFWWLQKKRFFFNNVASSVKNTFNFFFFWLLFTFILWNFLMQTLQNFQNKFKLFFLPMKTLKIRPQKLLIIGQNPFFHSPAQAHSLQPKIDFSYYEYVPRHICLLICAFDVQKV